MVGATGGGKEKQIRLHGMIFNYMFKYKTNLPSFLPLCLSKGYGEVFKLVTPHRTSSDCGWRRRPPEMDGKKKYFEQEVPDKDAVWYFCFIVGCGLTQFKVYPNVVLRYFSNADLTEDESGQDSCKNCEDCDKLVSN
jgi:hypothetical protein